MKFQVQIKVLQCQPIGITQKEFAELDPSEQEEWKKLRGPGLGFPDFGKHFIRITLTHEPSGMRAAFHSSAFSLEDKRARLVALQQVLLEAAKAIECRLVESRLANIT